MAVQLVGQPVAEALQAEVALTVAEYRSQGITPHVVTVLVEGDPASMYYARAKERMAKRLGIDYTLMVLSEDVEETTLMGVLRQLNHDPAVHGIMLELPLPDHINAPRVMDVIAPQKDVDGLTSSNATANMTGAAGIYPATPLACIRLVKGHGISLKGKHAVLVGCGRTVGLPLFHALIREGATVTACHVHTADLSVHLQQAEIAFVAVGQPKLITPDMVHPNLVLVDAGINETDGQGIVGDVDPSVSDIVAALSPTPGGVGTVTTTQLFANLMTAMNLQYSASPQLRGWTRNQARG